MFLCFFFPLLASFFHINCVVVFHYVSSLPRFLYPTKKYYILLSVFTLIIFSLSFFFSRISAIGFTFPLHLNPSFPTHILAFPSRFSPHISHIALKHTLSCLSFTLTLFRTIEQVLSPFLLIYTSFLPHDASYLFTILTHDLSKHSQAQREPDQHLPASQHLQHL